LEEEKMESIVLKVEGMSCSHCENAIKKAVGALAGVNGVTVDLKKKTVKVDYDSSKVTTDSIKNEITEQGYDVI
jgi:copper chaperone